MIFRICLIVLLACLVPLAQSRAQLPAVPIPKENPITESKRVLGKILFWDEQLSSDDSVACGTCHRPAFGGADPRAGVNPGQEPGSIDNVAGSPGIVSLDQDGLPLEHEVFGFERQITPRLSPSNFASLWADELFWDGRAGSEFTDPLTGEVVIVAGGALENQAIAALTNEAEMAKAGRTWQELAGKIRGAQPLALASDLPADIAAALGQNPTYASLFVDAFGNDKMTPVQIAFALATYQRTLVADQTPWDLFQAGNDAALSPDEKTGWREFQAFHCDACHVPPLFTNNDFFNIGIRKSIYDRARQDVSGNAEDAGDVKVPGLRNVGLRPRFMHTGEFDSLNEALGFYVDVRPSQERDEIPGFGVYNFNFVGFAERNIRAFIGKSLTDPRVANEQYPFDRPTLHSERSTN